MANQAHVDPVTTQVIGWYWHDEFSYTNLPPAAELVDVPPGVWDTRLDTNFMLYQNGQFIPTDEAPPPPSSPFAKGR
jgi:hypothetical protein